MQNLKCLLIFSLTFFTIPAFSQHIFIGNEETNRKLKWSDFQGPVDRSSPHHAMTTWEMEYSIDDIERYGDSIHIGKLIANVKMSPTESWCIKDKLTDELLKHEQGHFDIGILCMKEFLSIFHQTTFTKNNFDDKMKKIFNDALNKYGDLGNQYDRETDHSNNVEAQQLWNQFFAKYK